MRASVPDIHIESELNEIWVVAIEISVTDIFIALMLL